jgi:valyl-tRNA synthetase
MNDAFPKDGFDPSIIQHPINQFVVEQLKACKANIESNLESYRFSDASRSIYDFVWGTFCDWYLEFTKPLLATASDKIKAETRGTTGWVLEQILLLLNPFMPYITEELYAQIGNHEKGKKLLVNEWPDYSFLPKEHPGAVEIRWLQGMISEIRSVRADMNVPAGAKIELLIKDASAKTKERVKTYDAILKQMARLANVGFTDTPAPAGSIQCVVEESTLIMPVADIIDLSKERERLQKQIEKLESDIKGIDQKLGNEQFVSNAPVEIVDEFKGRKEQALETLKKLAVALKHLSAA